MSATPYPVNEEARLRALAALDVLDSEPEHAFDALVRAASALCGTPISLVSLVDSDRQWFKANLGLPGSTEIPRDVAFCAYAIAGEGLFEVPDATIDPRFSDNPLVTGDPDIRFYAGVPLRTLDGSQIGTLCVMDRQPRRLDLHQREVLEHLAAAVVYALQGRRALLAEHQLCVAGERAAARFRGFTSSLPVGIFATDPSGACTYTNARWHEIYGLTYEQSLGDGWTTTVHPEDRQAIYTRWRRDAARGAEFDMAFRLLRPDGSVRHVHARAKAVIDSEGRIVEHIGSVEDVTPLRALAADLAEQHELLRVTLQSIGDAVITSDPGGQVTWLNPVAERMTGWSTEEAKGRPLDLVFHIIDEETRQPTQNPVSTCLARGQIVGLANRRLLISRHGSEFGIEDSAAPIRDASGEILGVVLVFHDVTEQRRLSGEMSYRATHDALTGLVNRSEFEARLRRSLQTAHEEGIEHALIYIDLDQFKLVNDACGHTAGDMLLQQVSKILEKTVRSRDTLARLGGDEFAILLEHCTCAQAQHVAQQICECMDAFRFHHDNRRFRIGASIGLVPLDSRWSTTAAAMQAADTSCYAAKEAGRNRVHVWFDTDLTMHTRHGEMRWATRIEAALDDDQFVLYAQRIFSLEEPQQTLHAEVLLRMVSGDGSLIPPGAFLPAAERFHLATRIDRWVLRRTIEMLQTQADTSFIELVCVNLSGQSIGDRAFHRSAIELLRGAGAEICQRLCLEITETTAVTNLADASLFIEQVQRLGVRIALDDFGAGASSFGYLKSLAVDLLKIDGQFVKDIIDDPLDDAAVRCFVDVASVIGVKTVGEFVDTPAVLARLREIHVDYAQGFLLHRPEPFDVVLREAASQHERQALPESVAAARVRM